jgi:hypothetical protein
VLVLDDGIMLTVVVEPTVEISLVVKILVKGEMDVPVVLVRLGMLLVDEKIVLIEEKDCVLVVEVGMPDMEVESNELDLIIGVVVIKIEDVLTVVEKLLVVDV